ncbi:hypothetical protein D4740_09485 [Actinomyces sp. 2119]|uniref:hypothetical protein n=1 Tax=Actinomyces sp. 2119 TaxID=2321393 RepID=UPI000E6C9CCF|nr:hypothetical protein [Actinomyces sp. 2119]RJF41146.1 hypothetical protein D4740_09485 [Actinomyces sp. 2119]
MAEGRATANQVRGVRGDAMAATVPGREPLARNVFRVVALVVGATVVLGCLWYGTTVAREIGASLRSADDWFFFAGLLEVLGDFWDGLGPGGQILLTAVAVGLLGMAGMSLALGVTGVATWAMSHGRGLSAFVRDPMEATRSYARAFTLEQLALDALDFGLTFMPGSALSAGTRSAARSLASSRAAMARAEDLGEMFTHFQRHAELDATLRAAQARLGSIMPPGYTARDFGKKNLKDSVKQLKDAGYTDKQITALKDAVRDVRNLRGARNRAAEYVGERGGEQVLTREGYYIPQSFRSTGPHQAGPGNYAVDSMAVSPSGDHIVIPEIKGGSATVSTKPVQTLHEGYASQATPPYVRDRMLRDQRMVQFFRDNPALWESVKMR